MAVAPGVVQVLPDGSVSVTQRRGHSPRFQTTKLRLQKDEESAVRAQLTAARMCIQSHHCPVESLSVPVNCRVFSRFTGPYAVLCSSRLPSGPVSSAHCIQPVGTSFCLSHGPVLSCPWGFACAFCRLRPPSFYILLARAYSCSSSGPLLLPVSSRACFSSLRWRWCPLLWASRVPWTSSDLALTHLLHSPLPPASHWTLCYMKAEPTSPSVPGVCCLPALGLAHSRCSETDGWMDGWESKDVSGLPDSQVCALSSAVLVAFPCSAVIGG